MVLATLLILFLIQRTQRTLVWILIAAFFAVALSPAVSSVQRRFHLRRSLATLLVFLVVLIVLSGLIAAFVTPLARQADDFAAAAPGWLADARAGRGSIGGLVERFNLLSYVNDNQEHIRKTLSGLGMPAAHVLALVGEAVAATLSIFVLAFLMVLEGPRLIEAAVAQLPGDRAERVRRVSSDCAKTVTGYLTGNLLISVICGVSTWIALKVMGVPFAGVIALFVAVADLIPLIGATLGAIVAVIAAFVHSVPAGVVLLVWFLFYQQIENHLLQPVILSRTVKLNPLTVLIAILVGVELAGILGALLAIPVAGVIQVIVRDLYDPSRGQVKDEPTVGEEQVPVSAI